MQYCRAFGFTKHLGKLKTHLCGQSACYRSVCEIPHVLLTCLENEIQRRVPPVRLGRKILGLRKRMGLNQSEFVDRLDYSAMALSRFGEAAGTETTSRATTNGKSRPRQGIHLVLDACGDERLRPGAHVPRTPAEKSALSGFRDCRGRSRQEAKSEPDQNEIKWRCRC